MLLGKKRESPKLLTVLVSLEVKLSYDSWCVCFLYRSVSLLLTTTEASVLVKAEEKTQTHVPDMAGMGM